MSDKRIVIEFNDKGRTPTASDYMPPEEAEREFARVAGLLEESGTDGDRWIKVGNSVVVKANEVHNIRLDEEIEPAYFYSDD